MMTQVAEPIKASRGGFMSWRQAIVLHDAFVVVSDSQLDSVALQRFEVSLAETVVPCF
jgi:hypothetical protein